MGQAKKAQITVFIIVGLLVMVIGGLVLLMQDDSQPQPVRSGKDFTSMFSSGGKYNEYVMGCVSQAAEEGLFLIGMQGGVLYDYQIGSGKYYMGPPRGNYGDKVLPYGFEDVVYNVSYGIVKPRTETMAHPPVPGYPYGPISLISDPRILDQSYVNSLGNYPPPGPMPPLCDSNGKNRRQGAAYNYTCETYDSNRQDDKSSVQEMLQSYVTEYVDLCVDLSQLPDLEGVSRGSINTSITLGEQDVRVDITFPIYVESSGQKTSISLDTFSKPFHIRLKKIHELATHVIEADVNNIFFDVSRDSPSLSDCRAVIGDTNFCQKPGMDVYRLSDVCLNSGLCSEGKYDDLIVIEDKQSILRGKPYRFQFAAENRAPALDYINGSAGVPDDAIDIVAYPGEKILLEPRAYDPDEDFHNAQGFMDGTYYYEGWRETVNEKFDCILYNIQSGGIYSLDVQRERYMIDDFVDSTPRDWTSSEEFILTSRDASYNVSTEAILDSDKGLHYLTVGVVDSEGLKDYQELRILVTGDC